MEANEINIFTYQRGFCLKAEYLRWPLKLGGFLKGLLKLRTLSVITNRQFDTLTKTCEKMIQIRCCVNNACARWGVAKYNSTAWRGDCWMGDDTEP